MSDNKILDLLELSQNMNWLNWLCTGLDKWVVAVREVAKRTEKKNIS